MHILVIGGEIEMEKQQIKLEKQRIDGMSQYQMAHLYRFSPAGHPYFVRDTELCEYFSRKFHEAGGWTSEISKKVGWEK